MSRTVFVLEPQTVFLPELSRIVAAAGGRVTTCADAFDVVEISALRADYALLDLDYALPGVLDGLAYFVAAAPRVKPILLTHQRDFRPLARYRDAGAVVLPKSLSSSELMHALRAIFIGDAYPLTFAAPRRVRTVYAEHAAVDARV
jgi:DNA-binding NarL/FixJ family response regulator